MNRPVRLPWVREWSATKCEQGPQLILKPTLRGFNLKSAQLGVAAGKVGDCVGARWIKQMFQVWPLTAFQFDWRTSVQPAKGQS